MNNKELIEVRDLGMDLHRGWKQRSRVADLMVQGKWSTLWPDKTLSETEAAVENVYLEALEDKVASAGMIRPYILSPPTRGTEEDRAERNAQLRRRAFISMARDSRFEAKQRAWYFDWFGHAAMYSVPWIDWHTDLPWHPYAVRLDPRFAYPLSHNSNDELTSVFFLKYRRLVDVRNEYGADHPTVQALEAHYKQKSIGLPETVEEMWWFDTQTWGVAVLAASNIQPDWFRYVDPTMMQDGAPFADWLIPATKHKMSGCPVVETARRTSDGEYRSPLEPMIPQLKVAHSLMSRLLDDVDFQIYAPRGVEGVENPEDYGPGAVMIGDGSGNMRFASAREPMNFEAMTHIQNALTQARSAGAFPQQRSGDFGASIASAKGVTAVQGAYNSQQAWAQSDMAMFWRDSLVRLAELDEAWCAGVRKNITGWDEGELYTDKYDPGTLWKGDYRVDVGYHNYGLDESNHLLRLASFKNMGGMARRTFMRQSGLIDNPLAEEREIALEMVSDGFLAFLFQQAQSGNIQPMLEYVKEIDGDDVTARTAAINAIKKMFGAVAGQGMPGGQGGPNAGTALRQQRSLEQGGIPGNAAQLPAVSPDLLAMLPSGPGAAIGETLPG